jgi:hypothetical protein
MKPTGDSTKYCTIYCHETFFFCIFTAELGFYARRVYTIKDYTFDTSDAINVFIVKLCILSRSTADEEPLVDGSVNRCRGELLVRRQRGQGLGGNAAGGVLDSHVGAREEEKC